MEDKRLKRSKKVLLFNKRHYLVGIACSTAMLADLVPTADVAAIANACTGRSVSCRGFYFRYLAPTFEVTANDFGSLTITEYDNAVGIHRKVRETDLTKRKRFFTT